MNSDPGAPRYYHSLRPLRAEFRTGLPILMYHKIALPPVRARARGLYVTPRAFDRQLGDLVAGGFSSVPLGEAARPGPASLPRVVLTFDDGYTNVWSRALPVLRGHRMQGIVYLVAGKLAGRNDWDADHGEVGEPLMNAEQVRDWLAAGQEIGSHSLTHPHLTRVAPAEARQEIEGSRKLLEDTFGVPVRHFCYPYGDLNPAVRDLVAGAGYSTAVTTESGVNGPDADAFALRRFLVRHRRPWLIAWTHHLLWLR
jgi:peptidoglycan/xylan/chitin deacetylase (PgdA/CDA1 family)